MAFGPDEWFLSRPEVVEEAAPTQEGCLTETIKVAQHSCTATGKFIWRVLTLYHEQKWTAKTL